MKQNVFSATQNIVTSDGDKKIDFDQNLEWILQTTHIFFFFLMIKSRRKCPTGLHLSVVGGI